MDRSASYRRSNETVFGVIHAALARAGFAPVVEIGTGSSNGTARETSDLQTSTALSEQRATNSSGVGFESQ